MVESHWAGLNEKDARVTGAQRARCLNKIVFAHFQHLPANQTRVTDPTNNAERKDQFVQACAQKATIAIANSKPGKARKTLNT